MGLKETFRSIRSYFTDDGAVPDNWMQRFPRETDEDWEVISHWSRSRTPEGQKRILDDLIVERVQLLFGLSEEEARRRIMQEDETMKFSPPRALVILQELERQNHLSPEPSPSSASVIDLQEFRKSKGR